MSTSTIQEVLPWDQPILRAGAMRKVKERTFSSGLTMELAAAIVANLGIAAVIGFCGARINQTWHDRGDLFLALAAVLALATLWEAAKSQGSYVRVTPHTLAFGRGRREVEICWREIKTFAIPRRPWFRSAIIADRRQQIEIPSHTFPDFELIVNLVGVARKHYQEKAWDV